MHLVDEEHRALPAGQVAARGVEDLADVLDSGGDRGDLDEFGVVGTRHHRGDGGLADPGRPPQENAHRGLPTGQPPQRGSLAQQVLLADDLINGPRPQPHRQRRPGMVGPAQAAARRPARRLGLADVPEEILCHPTSLASTAAIER